MRKVSTYTKWKVVSGYITLFILTLLLAVQIHKQITHLINNEVSNEYDNQKLFLLNNITTSLFEAEGLGYAFIQTGSKEYFRDYLLLLKQTGTSIDSLKIVTSNLEQTLRIDTIHLLLAKKTDNLQELAWIKRRFIPNDLYDKAIEEAGSDRNHSRAHNIQRRLVVKVDSSYIKSEKKKRRWLFSKTEQDSTLRLSTRIYTETDTIHQSDIQTKDSVVQTLKSAWENVQKQTQDLHRQIDRKEDALISQNTDITGRLKRILNEYEQEEFNQNRHKQENRKQALASTLRIFATITIMAFLLILFFTFFILRDLSHSQQYRLELENANQYTQQLLQSREKMIQTVTHDIKSPLSSVIGYIELLHDTATNERQRYFLKNMKGSSEHILQLVGNLLDLSKLENNKMTVEEVIFNPYILFQEIKDNFLPLAGVKQLNLSSEISEELNQGYRGDALRIRQIITNILSNAVKYTPTGNVLFTATPSTEGNIVIVIQDSGTGMTPEEQQIIFEEFTRLTSHASIEGTGLGLTITLKLIHLLNGQIHLESIPGKGSCFTIILPLSPTITETQAAVEDSHIPRLAEEINILLVDDDPLQLEMSASLLATKGIKAETTTHPEEVIKKLNTKHYDLLFSDIQMPRMNGFEVVKQIRAQPSFATIPVIALSADSTNEEKDYLAAGFTAFLAKPFTPQQLFQLINKQINTRIETNTQQTETPLTQGYTLEHMLKFTDNDREALKEIIESFITATKEHILLLEKYIEEKQWTQITRLAHKMLPMFRQLEAQEVIIPLEALEVSEKNALAEEVIKYNTLEAIEKAHLLIQNIQLPEGE